MDLTLRTETFTQDDQSWLGSAHGTDMGRSITLDTSTFTEATHYPDGFLKSGLPLGKITATGKYGPYDDAAVDGRTNLAGFLLSPVRAPADTTIDPQGSLYIHGVVVTAKLPIDVSAAAADVPMILFV